MIINTPAVVLKSFPYGETSIIARCYTKEQGKVSLIVKGARRKKSPLAAYFQPMNYLDISLLLSANTQLTCSFKSVIYSDMV